MVPLGKKGNYPQLHFYILIENLEESMMLATKYDGYPD